MNRWEVLMVKIGKYLISSTKSSDAWRDGWYDTSQYERVDAFEQWLSCLVSIVDSPSSSEKAWKLTGLIIVPLWPMNSVCLCGLWIVLVAVLAKKDIVVVVGRKYESGEDPVTFVRRDNKSVRSGDNWNRGRYYVMRTVKHWDILIVGVQ